MKFGLFISNIFQPLSVHVVDKIEIKYEKENCVFTFIKVILYISASLSLKQTTSKQIIIIANNNITSLWQFAFILQFFF